MTSARPVEQRRERPETSAAGLFWTLVALLALAGLSLALRFAHLGTFGFAAGLGIATAKAVLVAVFFMEIRAEKPAIAFAFVTGILLVAVFLGFVLADVVTRAAPPLANPPGTSDRWRG